PSGELVRLCDEKLLWKKSTTYTMLKRLCDKKIFSNENGMVVALISPEEFKAEQGKQFIGEAFNGSLPKFLVAFTKQNKLSKNDIEQLQKLIDEYKED
ncbi:MAG: BlaI/MecI/CopY family transcriptional regulator, partial [Oscillospiraceae bacterium]